MKFKIKIVEVKAYELCLYWSSDEGLDTIDDIFKWESQDVANRRVYAFKSEQEVNSLLSNKEALVKLAC